MTCTCPKNPKIATGGNIVLSKNEIYKLRTGKVLDYHFHGSQFFGNRIIFFLSDEKNKVTEKSRHVKNAQNYGEVCPIVLTKNQIKALTENSNMITFKIPFSDPFEVTVLTQVQYENEMKNIQHNKEKKHQKK